jgi:hypothetical protein
MDTGVGELCVELDCGYVCMYVCLGTFGGHLCVCEVLRDAFMRRHAFMIRLYTSTNKWGPQNGFATACNTGILLEEPLIKNLKPTINYYANKIIMQMRVPALKLACAAT